MFYVFNKINKQVAITILVDGIDDLSYSVLVFWYRNSNGLYTISDGKYVNARVCAWTDSGSTRGRAHARHELCPCRKICGRQKLAKYKISLITILTSAFLHISLLGLILEEGERLHTPISNLQKSSQNLYTQFIAHHYPSSDCRRLRFSSLISIITGVR